MDSFFSPDIFGDLHTRGVNAVGLSDKIVKERQGSFDNKTQKLKRGDILARARGNLTAVILTEQTRFAHVDRYAQTTGRRQLS
jgi:hypothetical protein